VGARDLATAVEFKHGLTLVVVPDAPANHHYKMHHTHLPAVAEVGATELQAKLS
jgi:hypothetical protein